LVHKIDLYVAHHNHRKRPFVWATTADSILEKLHRLCKFINGREHWLVFLSSAQCPIICEGRRGCHRQWKR